VSRPWFRFPVLVSESVEGSYDQGYPYEATEDEIEESLTAVRGYRLPLPGRKVSDPIPTALGAESSDPEGFADRLAEVDEAASRKPRYPRLRDVLRDYYLGRGPLR
jgi:hypothetical protein